MVHGTMKKINVERAGSRYYHAFRKKKNLGKVREYTSGKVRRKDELNYPMTIRLTFTDWLYSTPGLVGLTDSCFRSLQNISL